MVTMELAIQSGHPEAIGDLLGTMSEAEGIVELRKTYGGEIDVPILNLNQGKNGLFRGTSPIAHAASTGQVLMFSAVLDAMRSKQLKIPLKGDGYRRTVLSLAAGSGDRTTFDTALTALKEELTDDELRAIVLQKDKAGTTILMAAVKSGSNETFAAALEAASALADGKVPELIASSDKLGYTLLSAAVKWKDLGLLEAVLRCSVLQPVEGLTREQVTAVLTGRCLHGSSLMLGAATSGNVDIWDAVINALCKHLGAEKDSPGSLLNSAQNGRTSRRRTSYQEQSSSLDTGCVKISMTTLRHMMLARCRKNYTILVYAAYGESTQMWQKIVTILREGRVEIERRPEQNPTQQTQQGPREQQQQPQQQQQHQSSPPIQPLQQQQQQQAHREQPQQAQDQAQQPSQQAACETKDGEGPDSPSSPRESLIKEMLRLEVDDGGTVLGAAAASGNMDMFRAVFATVQEELEQDEVNKILSSRDSLQGKATVLMAAVYGRSIEVFKEVLKIVRDRLPSKQVLGLLLETTGCGDNLFSCAVKLKDSALMNTVLDALQSQGRAENQEHEVLTNIFKATDGPRRTFSEDGMTNGHTVLYHAVKSGSIEIWDAVVGAFQTYLPEPQAREVLTLVLSSRCENWLSGSVFCAAAGGQVVDWIPVVNVFSQHMFFQRYHSSHLVPWLIQDCTLLVSNSSALVVDDSGVPMFQAVLQCLLAHLDSEQILRSIGSARREAGDMTDSALSSAVFSRDSELFKVVLQFLRKYTSIEQIVKMLICDHNRNEREVLSEIMIRQEHEMLKAVLEHGEMDPVHEQAKRILTSRDKKSNTVLLRAAASGHAGVWQVVMDSVHDFLPDKVTEVIMENDDNGDTVLVKAVESGGSELFKVVLSCLRDHFRIEQVRDVILSKGKAGTTVLVAAFKLEDTASLEAVLEILKEAGQPMDKQVAGVLGATATFSACAEASLGLDADLRRAALNVLSFLMENHARPSPDDLIKLSRKARLASDGHFKTCCLQAVASAMNPFIPGMTLSLMLIKAAEKAPEGERKGLISVQQSVDALLLEILERLPQTVRAFEGGMDDCAFMFEPDLVGSAGVPTGTPGPLSLLLEERQQREVFCNNPLVTDFLSRRFTRGLPDLRDTTGVLNDAEKLMDLEGQGGGNGLVLQLWEEKLDDYCTHLLGSSSWVDDGDGRDVRIEYLHKILLGSGRLSSILSPRTLLQGANARFPSLALLPGAQFIAAGVVANPSSYYSVPAMRMVLDFVVYLAMLAVLSAVILFYGEGTLAWEEIFFAVYILSGGIRELREIKRDVGAYFEDRWNVFDVLGLTTLTAGLIVRGVDSSSRWGRGLYVLSTPLFFSRLLFFAQILRFQGPMIQVIFSMTEELVKFGIVIVIVMLGFAVPFYALFRDSESFRVTLLNLFKAMLGEVGFFDEFSGGPDDAVATILLVVYLVIMTVMLLNLLIAILSTSHAKVQENAEREFKVSKALMIKHYRLVVKEHLLPAPFNLVQLVVSLPFKLLDCLIGGKAYERAKKTVGRMVFWLIMGFVAVTGGTLLWIASVFYSIAVWRKHYFDRRELSKLKAITARDVWRMEMLKKQDALWPRTKFMANACLTLVLWCVVGAPVYLLAMWLGLPQLACVLLRRRAGVSEPPSHLPSDPGMRNDDLRKYGTKADKFTVEYMLKRAPGGVGADDLRRYLEDPIIDDEVREDEKIRPASVEHVKLLRNRLENSLNRKFEELREITSAVDERLRRLEPARAVSEEDK